MDAGVEKMTARRAAIRLARGGGNGFGLTTAQAAAQWATPTVDDANNVTRATGQQQSLARDTFNWSTPRAEDGERGENSEYAGLMEDARNWATPVAKSEAQMWKEKTPGQTGGNTLKGEVRAWATPTEQDSANVAGASQYDRNSDPLNVEAAKFETGATPSPSEAPTAPSGSSPGRRLKRGLNPRFGLWLMGYRVEWLDSEPSATRSSRAARSSGRSRA